MDVEIKFIRDFKSIDEFGAICLPGLSVITGLNGAGKTHLLHAIKDGHVKLTMDGSEIPKEQLHHSNGLGFESGVSHRKQRGQYP